MTRLAAIALILATTTLGAPAAPRVAVVRIKDIYAELPSTAELQKQIKDEREGIMKDQRAEELRRIIGELQALQAQLSDKNNPVDKDNGRKLARSYELKRQEAQTLQREFENFRAEREKAINRKMVSAMHESLTRIHETARRIGAEQDCDLVFDSSGNTNTGVPFILYQKNQPDLTVAVKAALLAPAAPAPASPATPTTPTL
jgi:Skp family chaperone for outer membrane proteins